MAFDSEKLRNWGYEVVKCQPSHGFLKLREYILSNINEALSDLSISYSDWDDFLARYATNADCHQKLSTKTARLLNKDQVEQVNEFEFMNSIKEIIGEFNISDEEAIGYPEIYWRVVRPLQKEDVGPLHADSWFWELNPEWMDNNKTVKRTKVWIPLQCEEGKNGLLVKDRSHRNNEYKYAPILKDKKYKPIIINAPAIEEMTLLSPSIGNYVIFNDNLIHGGAKNLGKFPRVSLEFTCLTRI
tara:strand:+ start:7742 stop:8470 length:729 start_codon:yes stop_codon:yes gene_type:complete